MTTSKIDLKIPDITNMKITDDAIIVELNDGRSITVPLAWYPRLLNATVRERNNWRLIGKGQGIHWEELDEDLSVEGMLLGQPSGESQTSFKRWLEKRNSVTIRRKRRGN